MFIHKNGKLEKCSPVDYKWENNTWKVLCSRVNGIFGVVENKKTRKKFHFEGFFYHPSVDIDHEDELPKYIREKVVPEMILKQKRNQDKLPSFVTDNN